MVKSIEEYISETTKSYDPAIKAYNTQLSGLSGQTENAIKDIENQYANQRSQLLTQANQAAEAASLSAAANGGGFSGLANEANRKYYERSFVPAMTSSNTNRASAISQAQANEANRRSSLEQQLANLYTQANTYGTQRYDQAVAAEAAQRQFEAEMAEKQRQYNENLALQKAQQEEAIRQYNENLALQKAQLEESKRQHDTSIAAQDRATAAATRAASYIPSSSSSGARGWDFGKGYVVANDGYGNAVYYKNGGRDRISAGEFLISTGSNLDNWNDIWNSGVRTAGVGADTLQAMNKIGNRLGSMKNGNQYNYLWSQY